MGDYHGKSFNAAEKAPCEAPECTIQSKCADNYIGCMAWKRYLASGKVYADLIGNFRMVICDKKCHKQKINCENDCQHWRA